MIAKFAGWTICLLLMVSGLSLQGQQTSSRMPARCAGDNHRISQVCKPVLRGVQAFQPSNDLPTHYDNSVFVTFEAPGAGTGPDQGTFPYSINIFGLVTGYYTDSNYVGHGFLRGPFGNVVTFDVQGGVNGTYPAAINGEGTVAGYYCDVNFDCPGFVRKLDGTITTFDVPGDLFGVVVYGINSDGAVAGWYFGSDGNEHSFVRTRDGSITEFDVSGAVDTYATSINSSGTIAGSYSDTSYHGFIRTRDGNLTTFDVPGGTNTGNFGSAGVVTFPGVANASINDQGAIATDYFQPIIGNPFGGNYQGALRKRDGTYDTFYASDSPPCCTWTYSSAIGPDQTITGYDNDGHDVFHGFIRTPDGTITTFDAPGAGTGRFEGTIPLAINPLRIVTGFYVDGNNVAHGYIRIPL